MQKSVTYSALTEGKKNNMNLLLLRKRLEWHNANGFFRTAFRPIPEYSSEVINDDLFKEFIREIGPIHVNNGDYLVLAVTLPSSYHLHEHWWRDTTPEVGEQLFNWAQTTVKIKDIQVVACDSSLYFSGFDITKSPPELVHEPDLEVKNKEGNFFLLIEELLRAHEQYCKIEVPAKFNM